MIIIKKKRTNQRLALFLAKIIDEKKNLCTDEKRKEKLIKDFITLHVMSVNLIKSV